MSIPDPSRTSNTPLDRSTPGVPPSAEDLAASIAQQCEQAVKTSSGWQACCPAHDDSTPSLSIAASDTKVLLKCHAGCPPAQIVAALGLTMAHLFTDVWASGSRARQSRKEEAVYHYVNLDGTVVHETVRYRNADGGKTFRQRRPHPTAPGTYLWSLKGIDPVLYRLPQVAAAIAAQQPVFVVEGEKDADALTALGITATCNPMGAGKWRASYSAWLRGARCIIVPDNDAPGRAHADTVARALAAVAASVKVLDLPGLPPKGDAFDWLTQGGSRMALEALAAACPAWTPDASTKGAAPAGDGAWTAQLMRNQKGNPIENITNLSLILENHPEWKEAFWWDTVRALPMYGDVPVDDSGLIQIARQLGLTMSMSLRSLRLLEACVRAVCQQHPRDLLKEWLEALAPWDGVERLSEWLHDVAGVTKDQYGMDVSRLLPVAMVARALNPGCQFRDVVILEGPENSGKSKLVKTLASPTWYVDFDVSMDSKEAFMLIQGRWVAELAELATLTRTEEAKLKSFLTIEEDVWIPKYSNFAHHVPRRTIFIGTVNPEDEYLKGQTGNTRFLPIKTAAIDCTLLEEMRPQLFAEALVYFQAHPSDWWQLSEEGIEQAIHQRENRRQSSIYETELPQWLASGRFDYPYLDPDGFPVKFTAHETSWPEIAQYYLKIDREKWKDKSLQMQISQALRADGWEKRNDRKRGTQTRYWGKRPETTM